MGGVAGAVYTVTLLPPPCGTNAMDSTLTPIVAQSSLDASVISIDTLAVCGVTGEGAMLEPPPPPQAAISAASAPTGNIRDALGTMIDVSSKLTINIPGTCWHLRGQLRLCCLHQRFSTAGVDR